MDSQNEYSLSPHVLIFPLPALGHINPTLHLAELLCLANINVTFINTIHNQLRLTQYSNIESRFSGYSGFRFETVPDGLSEDHPRTGDSTGDWLKELVKGLEFSAKGILREILVGLDEREKVTCMILDGWMSFVEDIAKEVDVPIMICRCSSACSNWCYSCVPDLIQAGEIPFKDEEMDQLVKNAPGMNSFLRYRDLPSYCRNQDESSCQSLHDLFNAEKQKNKRAQALILNTFEDLEGPTLSLIDSHISKVYSIGPLHAHLKSRLHENIATLSNNRVTVDPKPDPNLFHNDFWTYKLGSGSKSDSLSSLPKSSSTLWEADRNCLTWLDQRPTKSVVYVSFGSLTILTRNQLLEFWAGLVQSKKHFLWVIRPNLLLGSEPNNSDLTPNELLEGTKERGYMVGWVPQEEVLNHKAIGGFLTHSGWNSILESIVAGVPMLSWPFLADQQVNSRFVSEVWRIGLDMKDICDKRIVEKMVNDLMDGKKDELQSSMDKISQLAKMSVSEGGSSYINLEHLIEEIKGMAKKGKY